MFLKKALYLNEGGLQLYQKETPTLLFSYKYSEAATGGVLWKKLFFKVLRNSQENSCARVSF